MEEELRESPLPYDEEAERALIGGLLFDVTKVENIIDDIVSVLEPSDFYDPRNKVIYQAILDLIKEGKPVDRILVKNFLENSGKLNYIGGELYLKEIVEYYAAPPKILIELARQIKEKSIQRELIKTAKTILNFAKSPKNIDEVLEETEKLIFDITQKKIQTPYYSLDEVLKTTLDIINELYKKDTIVTGIPTGFTDLDRLIAGLHKGDLVVIAARPSMGKTSLALSILHNITVKENIPAAFFSLEMPKEQIVMRLLSQEARIKSTKLKTGMLSQEDLRAITEAALNMSKAPLFIDDSPSLTILDLRAKARRLKKEKEIQVIVIDYLQLLKSHKRTENRQQEVAEISRSLKALAKELEIPVVALAQLSRQTEMRADKRPQLADLRESGAIEQDADIVMFIHRPEYYKKNPTPEEKGIAEIIVAKHRNGPTDVIKLAFIKDLIRFENLDISTKEEAEEEEFTDIGEVDI